MNAPDNAKFAARSAIEALRAGVPSPAGVRALGCDQPRIEGEFIALLDAAAPGAAASAASARGLVIRGDFGTGKSHTLEFLSDLARRQNFICSRVYISKETPLHDPVKLFQAAADSAVAPDRTGSAFVEVAGQLAFNSPAYRAFERWANHTSTGLDARLPASLLLFERFQADHEFRDLLIRFWAGGKLTAGEVKSKLKQIGEPTSAAFNNQRELAIQRFRFASRMMRAAGYSGWVLLIDEVELIGSYSTLQRARAYIEIGRMMGIGDEPGMGAIPVLAVTEDFTHAVLTAKCDSEKIPAMLRERAAFADSADPALAAFGMRVLSEKGISLRRPGADELEETYGRIRDIYARAYGWTPPADGDNGDDGRVGLRRELSTPLRAYIRRWITTWDLQRLYPESAVDLETADWRSDYRETPDEAGDDAPSDRTLIDDVLGDI
jgi:hypothetical protein